MEPTQGQATDRDRRKRSHSPRRDEGSDGAVKRQRSRSPHRHKHHRHRERSPKAKLPFRSQHLRRHDYDSYRALFAEYLDLQKQLDIDQLDEDEVKGRWKRFRGRWNSGELAEGWYDPETKKRADERSSEPKIYSRTSKNDPIERNAYNEPGDGENNSDDGYGPALPTKSEVKRGPIVPSLPDLQYRRELADEDRQAGLTDLRLERKQDRKQQKERLEELAPRAAPGSRERQLEKKREVAASNKAFAESKDGGGGAEEVGEADLLGDDGVENYKAKLKQTEKKRNEREIRKEEVLRARAAEREEKMAEHRRKEEKTMDMLRELARQRFTS